MAEPTGSDNTQRSAAETAAETVFSSEKREDIWALLIAAALLLLSLAAPAPVHDFFSNLLILF